MTNPSKYKHSRAFALLLAAFFCAFSVFGCRGAPSGIGADAGVDASVGPSGPAGPPFAPGSRGAASEPAPAKFGSFVLSSPAVLVNSASLGAWTATTNGINVAAGENVSVKLADSAGVRLWQLAVVGTDELVAAPTITQAVSVSGTATFTAPASPSDGWALIIRSQIGYTALGNDSTGRSNSAYATTFGVYLPTSNSYRVGAVNETVEGSAAFGWAAKFNPLLRATIATGSAVGTTRTISTSGLLQGGGDFSTNRTHSIVPGTNGQVITTAGGVPTWALIANANVSASAAIDLSKLGQGGATSGQAVTWNGSAWAPGTPASGVPTARTLTGTSPVRIDGGASGDLSANRTISLLPLVNADISASAAIAYSKLNLTSSIVNADVSSSAGILVSKLAAGGTANRVVLTTDGTNMTMGRVDLATTQVQGILPTANQAAQTLAGDVTGVTSANTVAKVKGTTITTAGGALTAGQSLRVTGSSTADWGSIDLTNASAVSGALPINRGGTGQTAFGAGVLQSDGSALFSGPTTTSVQSPFLGYDVAVNSLSAGWFWLPEWRNWLDAAYTDTVLPKVMNVGTASNGRIDLVWLNPQKNYGTTVRSQTNTLFTPAPGETAVNFTVKDARMPPAVANNTVDLTIYDGASTATPLFTQQFTLTQTLQDITLSATGLTAGHLYMAGLLLNKGSQQCNPYVGEVLITPTNTGTGLFAGSFVRLRFNPALAAGNLRQAYNSGNFFPLQTHFDIPFATSSSRLGVEVFQNSGGKLYYGSQGRWFLEGSALSNGNITIEDVSIPNPYTHRQMMPVTVRTDGNGGAADQGNQVRALYVEAGADYSWAAQHSDKEAVIYSDSIGCGALATTPALQGWPAVFRQRYPGRVVIEARPSRTLNSDCSSDSAIETFSTLISQNQPALFIPVIGVNDYLQNSWATIADFKSAYASLIDRIHLKSPRTKVMGVTPFRINVNAQGESPNANGIKLSDIRTAEQQVLQDASRASYCIYVDGTGGDFYAITDLGGDNIHPGSIGHGLAGTAIVRQGVLAGLMVHVPVGFDGMPDNDNGVPWGVTKSAASDRNIVNHDYRLAEGWR